MNASAPGPIDCSNESNRPASNGIEIEKFSVDVFLYLGAFSANLGYNFTQVFTQCYPTKNIYKVFAASLR